MQAFVHMASIPIPPSNKVNNSNSKIKSGPQPFVSSIKPNPSKTSTTPKPSTKTLTCKTHILKTIILNTYQREAIEPYISLKPDQ